MTDGKDPGRIHIILDANKVDRCDWCGSAQSEYWIHSSSEVFCSENCSKAAYISKNFALSVLAALSVLFMLFVAFVLPDSFFVTYNRLFAVVVFIVGEIMMIAIVIDGYKDRGLVLEIPKGSRCDIGATQISLLQRVSAPVECPNCDANLDLSEIKDDMIYHCKYCNATGVVELTAMKE